MRKEPEEPWNNRNLHYTERNRLFFLHQLKIKEIEEEIERQKSEKRKERRIKFLSKKTGSIDEGIKLYQVEKLIYEVRCLAGYIKGDMKDDLERSKGCVITADQPR